MTKASRGFDRGGAHAQIASLMQSPVTTMYRNDVS